MVARVQSGKESNWASTQKLSFFYGAGVVVGLIEGEAAGSGLASGPEGVGATLGFISKSSTSN